MNGQCVPVRGVRRDPVASDRPKSVTLNRGWPGMRRRQPLPVGSHSGYCILRYLRLGRSQRVFYRDPGRSCIVLVGQVIKRPNVDPYPLGRSGITRKESQTNAVQEVGLIHSSDDALGNLGRGISGKKKGMSGGEPKANHLRRNLGLVGAGVLAKVNTHVPRRREV